MEGGGDGSDGGGSVTAVTINIRCTNGSKFAVKVSLDSSVESFKSVLAKNCEIPVEQQRLIYKGGILKGDQTLKSYGLEAEHTVHLVRRFVPVASNNTAEEGATGGSGDSSGFPEIDQIQQQFIQNPNTLVEMIEQNIMNNVDVIRNMMMMSQIIDMDPELARIFNDPSIINQMTEEMMALLQQMQSLFSQLGQQQSTRSAGQMGGETVGPEVLYASQLAQLQEMGFPDTRQNLEALAATVGNIPAAVDRLLGQ